MPATIITLILLIIIGFALAWFFLPLRQAGKKQKSNPVPKNPLNQCAPFF
ncbi:hypothetical protein HQ544_01665 [Candidatus Falkowbacteria bacterium]|nr:hypothetical protein [Candidatus Falkowbacteria bacterium]